MRKSKYFRGYRNRGISDLIFIIGGMICLLLLSQCSTEPNYNPIATTTKPPTYNQEDKFKYTNDLQNPTQIISTLGLYSTSTPIVDLIGITGCVTARSLRIRSGPGTNYELVGGLVADNCVSLDGKNVDGKWVRFSKGWISAAWLNIQGDIGILPVVGGADNSVQSTKPSNDTSPSYPQGATAICNDGTYSHSQHRRGTCSHHGGVKQWLANIPP